MKPDQISRVLFQSGVYPGSDKQLGQPTVLANGTNLACKVCQLRFQRIGIIIACNLSFFDQASLA